MRITVVHEGSQAERLGVKTGDRIVAVNNHPVSDQLDVMFHDTDDDVRLTFHRGTYEYTIKLDCDADYGFELEPMDVRLCGNDCIFCFIDQNPPDMRKEIYVKDEDYRLSFLHGSYVTLTNLRETDLQRIVMQRLSPLYVSVHSTETSTRLKLLGLRREDHLIENMDRLLGAGIRMHCQIVVCPGINDGDILRCTIHDLRRRYPDILSVAVVPVGLTRHRTGLPPVKPVDEVTAGEIIDLADMLHDQYVRETDTGFVYCADELYIRAGRRLPDAVYYDDYPQIENGVGMVREFMEAVGTLEKRIKRGSMRSGRYVLVTGTSMAPFIGDLTVKLSAFPGIDARAITVENKFYGETVTVSGLLTGQDIRTALAVTDTGQDETVVLPPNCLNSDGLFLDDMTPDDLSLSLGIPVIQGDYDPVLTFLQ